MLATSVLYLVRAALSPFISLCLIYCADSLELENGNSATATVALLELPLHSRSNINMFLVFKDDSARASVLNASVLIPCRDARGPCMKLGPT